MATIKRRIAFVQGLQAELDARLQIANLEGTIGNVDGSATYDQTALTANAVNVLDQENVKKSQIIDNVTTGGATDVLSAEQGVVLKGLIDGLSTGLQYKGSFDASVETALPADTTTGDFYKISGAGTIDGLELAVGDMIIANADVTGATTATNFDKIDNTEAPDILRTGDVSTSADFAVDGTKLTDRATIKGYVDSQSAAAKPTFINETVAITTDSGTLSHEPADGVIFMGYAQVANGDGTIDLVSCTVTGTTLTLQPDTSGDYTGLQASVTYAYYA